MANSGTTPDTDSRLRAEASALAVLNSAGRDPFQSFADGPGHPGGGGHPPINYHAWAACMNGVFCRSAREVPVGIRSVLVLLRKRNLAASLRDIPALRSNGATVWISFKESGLHQIADFLADPGRVASFRKIAGAADGFVASTRDSVDIYTRFGCRRGRYLPTPYPVDFSEWDFSIPIAGRTGIFVGTREFDVPSRRHAEAILLANEIAAQTRCRLTVINRDKRAGRRLLNELAGGNPNLNIVDGPIAYPDYLGLLARHRIVLQLDRSAVPGQVAGDSLLCRVPCIGGNSAIERELETVESSNDPSPVQTRDRAIRLLSDDDFYAGTVVANQSRAAKVLSFGAGRSAWNAPV